MKQYIAYYRVSTNKQGESRLGLDSQGVCVDEYVKDKGIIISKYLEIESGKKNNRPELLKAIEECKLTGATLIVNKLDRLSRNVSFLFALKDNNIDFLCCDQPELNTLTLGIFATVAQYEREIISERTKKALAEKKKE